MISEKSLDKIKKTCLIAIPILIVLAIVFTVSGIFSLKKAEPSKATPVSNSESKVEDDPDALAKYPTHCSINEKLPELEFYDKNDKKVKLSDYKGKTVVLCFWASYCPYCKKQLEETDSIKKMIEQKDDVVLLLVDKLDNKKETAANAKAYLENSGLGVDSLYDKNIVSYNKLGVKLIPTTLLIDKDGVLRHITIDNYKASELESMIDYTKSCGTSATEKFITTQLTNKDGGIRTNFKNDLGKTNADDIISESQGLMSIYYAKNKDKANFEKTYNFSKKNMFIDNLAVWSVSKTYKKANSNAVIDDLRLVRALDAANKNFGGYDSELKNYAASIYKYNTNNSRLIDFYDFKSKKGAQTLKLCYADFEALDILSGIDPNFKKVRNNALDLVSEGYISDSFPFYRNSFNYNKKKFDDTKLNMAEEMETVLHMARSGNLPEATHQWLKKALDGDGVFGGYDTSGNVTIDGKFESTAVYGLIAETANALGDKELESKAIFKMEKMRIFDTSSKFDGAFGKTDGSGIYSFDQLVALLAYKDMGGA